MATTDTAKDIAPGCSCGGYAPGEMIDEIARYTTADRYPITNGMRVWTNDLRPGVVNLERASLEHNWNDHTNALWFHVVEDGDPHGRGVLQSHDRVAKRFNGKEA